ncbi:MULTISPECIES: transglycosylase domain-containing protein [unclassified Xanthomonas]|uniref:transglycosylase domain-containing protein n=1 Tax=Xanthomonas sp. LMG 9002 TaxID=1591158 RepID=UPI001369F1ED|nr:transglycosylase domain-containing protein [Xanthomonas sp. LMG 9002]
MLKIIKYLGTATALLILATLMAFAAYDALAVRPHLALIRDVLAHADPEESSPPQTIRGLIDANTRSPSRHAARMVVSRVYPDLTQGQGHVRNALWSILLPMHFDRSQMYGLYCVLSYNGIDYGLSSFANRQFGKPLSQLSPMQAATTVAITHAPTIYLRDPDRLADRARTLLARTRHPH